MLASIAKVKSQILTEQEYRNLLANSAEKPRILIYLIGDSRYNSVQVLVGLQRLLQLEMGILGFASLYTLAYWQKVLYSKTLIFGGSAACACLNLLYWSYMVKVRSSLVYKLEFDTQREVFVLT